MESKYIAPVRQISGFKHLSVIIFHHAFEKLLLQKGGGSSFLFFVTQLQRSCDGVLQK